MIDQAITDAFDAYDGSDLAFRRVVQALIENGLTEKDIARRFCVSISSVRRWADGKGVPHPAMRPPIIEALKKLVEEKLNAPETPPAGD